MNLGHLHLMINHFPVFALPVCLIFLVLSLRQRSLSGVRLALVLIAGTALAVLPVYFTGEPAEELIEKLPHFSEPLLATHESVALLALILTVATGVVALAALYSKRERRRSFLHRLVLGLGALATGSLILTASLGGQVGHPEIRSEKVKIIPPSEGYLDGH